MRNSFLCALLALLQRLLYFGTLWLVCVPWQACVIEVIQTLVSRRLRFVCVPGVNSQPVWLRAVMFEQPCFSSSHPLHLLTCINSALCVVLSRVHIAVTIDVRAQCLCGCECRDPSSNVCCLVSIRTPLTLVTLVTRSS